MAAKFRNPYCKPETVNAFFEDGELRLVRKCPPYGELILALPDGGSLNEWEREFLASILKRIRGNGQLSEKQILAVRRIHEKHRPR